MLQKHTQKGQIMHIHGISPSVSSVQCSDSERPLLLVLSQARYAKCCLLQQAPPPSTLDVVLVPSCHLGALQSRKHPYTKNIK